MNTDIKMKENREVIADCLTTNDEYVEMAATFKKKFGYEMNDEKNFPVTDRKFSFKQAERKLKEADSASAFPSLLRAGAQTICNNMYLQTATTFERFATVVQSKKDTELYPPIVGIAFPNEVAKGGLYPEVGMKGMDVKLTNKKFGAIFGVEYELSEDDQTGQVVTQSKALGEYMKIVMEVLCLGKLASVSGMQYAEYKIPVSETKPAEESTWPWSTALVGGGSTKPSSFAVLAQPVVQNAFIGLMNQKNHLGLKMQVNPTVLLHGPKYAFDSNVLAHSAYYPSVAGTVAGTTGGQFAINPMQGLFEPLKSRFVFKNDGTVNGDSTAWYLMDVSKPWFIAQIREPASVIVENPQSGYSFDRDVIRFKGRMRANADIIDPRFCWQGNDGSAT